MIKKGERAQPVCAFGKLYGDVSEARDIFQFCNVTIKDDGVKVWTSSKKHQYNIFYVSKEFYEEMTDASVCITREMYNTWLNYRT